MEHKHEFSLQKTVELGVKDLEFYMKTGTCKECGFKVAKAYNKVAAQQSGFEVHFQPKESKTLKAIAKMLKPEPKKLF